MLFGIESYLNSRAAHLRKSLICVGPASPAPLGFLNYLNNKVAHLPNYLICVDLASPVTSV